MLGTEEANYEKMRIDIASMICDNNDNIKIKSFSKECIKLCSSENRHMGIKVVLNHKKIHHISEMTRRHYHYIKKDVQYMIKKKNMYI